MKREGREYEMKFGYKREENIGYKGSFQSGTVLSIPPISIPYALYYLHMYLYVYSLRAECVWLKGKCTGEYYYHEADDKLNRNGIKFLFHWIMISLFTVLSLLRHIVNWICKVRERNRERVRERDRIRTLPFFEES